MGYGGAEDGHHGVADELLDRAAVPLELGAELRVVGGERRADVLRVETLRPRRRDDEVGEEDRHDLPLLAWSRGCRHERGPAHPAEAEPLGILLTAGRTGLHEPQPRTSARHGLSPALHSEDGLAGRLQARDARLVRAELRRADARAGEG